MIGLRDDLADLVPYDPDTRPVAVMLSANENNYGVPPEVRAEITHRLSGVSSNRYPEAVAPRLRALLAQMWGFDAAGVVVANGGDELLFNLILAFGGPGRALVNCPPTFSAYALYAKLTQTPVVEVARGVDFGIDEAGVLEAARRQDAALVILTSPNNPTGNLVSPAFVERLAASTEAIVLVDEAYAEFADPAASCVPLVRKRPNVVVLRTLSKAYCMAGARVGYALCSEQVASALLSVRLPYSVSRYDQAAAEAVVERAASFAPVIDAVKAQRSVLFMQLKTLSADAEKLYGPGALEVLPSAGNFISVRLRSDRYPQMPSAHDVHEDLASRYSILVRDFSSTPGLFGCLRVTVGMPGDNYALMNALRELLMRRDSAV